MKTALRLALVFLLLVILTVSAGAALARPAPDAANAAQNAGDTPRCQSSPVEQANMLKARRWLAAYEQANVPVMQELLADSFVNHTPPLPVDKAGFIADAVAFRASFPTGEFSIYSLMAQGDRVILYGHFQGVHTGAPFVLGPGLAIPAAGAVASFDFMVQFRLEDGQITDRWATGDDVMGLLIPLGFQLLPPVLP